VAPEPPVVETFVPVPVPVPELLAYVLTVLVLVTPPPDPEHPAATAATATSRPKAQANTLRPLVNRDRGLLVRGVLALSCFETCCPIGMALCVVPSFLWSVAYQRGPHRVGITRTGSVQKSVRSETEASQCARASHHPSMFLRLLHERGSCKVRPSSREKKRAPIPTFMPQQSHFSAPWRGYDTRAKSGFFQSRQLEESSHTRKQQVDLDLVFAF
jgi:hypothetical protein